MLDVPRRRLSADGVRPVDEEQFGPALPSMPLRHVGEALEQANATN